MNRQPGGVRLVVGGQEGDHPVEAVGADGGAAEASECVGQTLQIAAPARQHHSLAAGAGSACEVALDHCRGRPIPSGPALVLRPRPRRGWRCRPKTELAPARRAPSAQCRADPRTARGQNRRGGRRSSISWVASCQMSVPPSTLVAAATAGLAVPAGTASSPDKHRRITADAQPVRLGTQAPRRVSPAAQPRADARAAPGRRPGPHHRGVPHCGTGGSTSSIALSSSRRVQAPVLALLFLNHLLNGTPGRR